MAAPISKGRMIRQDISKSKGFAKLSRDSQVLFCMLIPHLNSFGKMNGNPHYLKGEVVPLLDDFDTDLIETCMREIHKKTNVKWFLRGGMRYIHSIHFEEHQELRDDRRGNDTFPDYSRSSPGLIQDPSGMNVNVNVEGEVEVEVEGEDKSLSVRGKNGKSNDASRSTPKNGNGLIDDIVKYCNDEKSRAMFVKAFKTLGEGMLWELFGELKMRVDNGIHISNRGAYMATLIKDRANSMEPIR